MPLTKEQQAVVTNRGGALLVAAAAGSGKTKVLIERVLSKVENENCNLDDFLMITFTKAAANELRSKLITRLSELLAEQPENHHLQDQMRRVYLAQISTVHSFCLKLLQSYGHLLDIAPDFRLCDDQECTVYQSRAMDDVLEDTYKRLKDEPQLEDTLNTFARGRNDSDLPELILNLYNKLQCYQDPNQRIAELREDLSAEGITDVGKTVWGRYLIDEFHAKLTLCEESLLRVLDDIDHVSSLEFCRSIVNDNLASVHQLMEIDSWDGLCGREYEYGTLRKQKSCTDLDLFERIKMVRERVRDCVREWLTVFRIPSNEALYDLAQTSGALHGILTLTERFIQRFQKEKENHRVLDPNDLEHLALRLLLGKSGIPTTAAREISQQFIEIMVDEYQDTNRVQDAIFRAISRDEKNLFFVGDVKQAIYRFRLADPTIFLEKYKTYADYWNAAEGEPRKILLSDNFRSAPAILSAANDVFLTNMTERVGGLRYGEREALRPNRAFNDQAYTPVELICVHTGGVSKETNSSRGDMEIELIARRIEKMLTDKELIADGETVRPIEPSDIVILCRKLKGKVSAFISTLGKHGIRCICGSDSIFDSEEIQIITALLKVLDNPHQDIPLMSLLFSPVFCFSTDDLARARVNHKEGDLFDALCAYEKAQPIVELIEEMRHLAGTSSLRNLLDTLDERLFLRTVFGAMGGGGQRLRNLDRFFAIADSYESSARFGLSGFISYLSLMEEKGLQSEDTAVSGCVRLMSVHKSKGLEFPVVFLADLCGEFNNSDAKSPILLDTSLGIGAKAVDTSQRLSYPTIARQAILKHLKQDNHSEEMRMLYVAMTRAKSRMIMTCCGGYVSGTLAKIVKERRMQPDELMIESAPNLGYWVMLCAMGRSEATSLYEQVGTPMERKISQHPWKIVWQDANELTGIKTDAKMKSAETTPISLISYSPIVHTAPMAETSPSKVTATQLKGRQLDEEAAEHTATPPHLHFPKPQFSQKTTLTASERGTAIHLAMQYLRYENCNDLVGIEQELDRLVEKKFITALQREAVDGRKLLQFFVSPLGKRIRFAKHLIREFKFSILEDASLLHPSLEGEQVLLQGVTDCCIMEDDGLTIIDFKSDYLRAGEEPVKAEYYRGQLDAYSLALEKVYERPVKEQILYFFATGTSISVTKQ